MMKCHSHGASVSNQKSVQHQFNVPKKTRSLLVSEQRLQDILIMFLDLGLTPREMSKASGFPLAVIVMGLRQLDEIPQLPTFLYCAKG